MRLILLSLFLTACASTPSGIVREGQPETSQSDKSLSVLEQCLTQRLSQVAEVWAATTGSETTLMLGERTRPTMLIDLAPPRVAVTTNFVYGTRPMIQACL